MTAQPLISIIVPTYNREAYLRQAVASVFAQTYDDWELVIVDDGSTDETRAYLDTLTDERVRRVLRGHCGNAALVRNVAVRGARGSHIAFLDSDDRWRPEKLALQMHDLAAHPECRWSYTGAVLVDERGQVLRPVGHRRRAAERGWILEEVIDGQAPIPPTTAVVERRLFEAVGGFDESLVLGEDLDLWIKLAEASQVTVVSLPLAEIRKHPGNQRTGPLDTLWCRNRIYEALLARTKSSRLRRLCRRAQVRVSLQIVGKVRRAGRYGEAWQALQISFRYARWHPGWWLAFLKTCLHRGIPGWLREGHRGAR